MSTHPLSPASILPLLPKARLVEIGRELGILVPSANKDTQVQALSDAEGMDLARLVPLLGRDELKAACRAHGLSDLGRARAELAERLLSAAAISVEPARRVEPPDARLPRPGDIIVARHRQYLVEAVAPGREPGEQTLVSAVCLDDDAQGRPLELLWERELGARILEPTRRGLEQVARVDPPRHFAAYLHAVKWSCASATDARLLQAPFRAGIRLKNYQLTPLRKALELPRVNLFIADDVGLGKTIEAGLVLQELLLRQRVELALVVCPASVCLQWRDEMERRFGLRFELYNRAFVARRRQERGFGVNPWTTHNRFIISYQTLRRPEYRDPLLQVLGERAKKSLLIMDEAHTAAPATASKYAVDSRITHMARDLAPRFENRLFLSATPHNGHSNSFSSLLEILDPQRFTRGVPVRGEKALAPVMVRRLKKDLRALGTDSFPERRVVQAELRHEQGSWQVRFGGEKPALLGEGPEVELRLSRQLAEYTRLARPAKGRGRLVFLNLQKRLLSSVEAFHRTLSLHASSLGSQVLEVPQAELDLDAEEDMRGESDEAQEVREATEVRSSTRVLSAPTDEARALLEQMVELSGQHRAKADAKVRALLLWMRRNQCAGVGLGDGAEGRWTDRRVIVFTEYADTKRYLASLLKAAVAETDGGTERILEFHGGMSDEARAEVQRAFNGPPSEYPVRVLLATDAAREGINLQGYCADLFHFDVPWNPARMEQRNGRIDRTLQPAPEVRCHYFVYPQRSEDRVLTTLVEKVDRIQRELGSLGTVVMDRLARTLEDGITDETLARFEQAEAVRELERVAQEELEAERASVQKLKEEEDVVGRQLNESRRVMDFDPVLLKDALDVGCELAEAPPLSPVKAKDGERTVDAWAVPPLPDSWQGTLDTLRPPRAVDEMPWDWRRRPLLPVVFEPPERLDSPLVHLHLQHPFAQRVLSRFLAQGFSAHDLSRVSVVRTSRDALARVLIFGRLTLFGPGAMRLHDEVVSLAAAWLESGGPGHLKPFAERADQRALEQLEDTLRESPTLDGISEAVRRRLAASAPEDFAALWTHLEAESESRGHEARRRLAQRGAEEAEALRRVLKDQQAAIEATLKKRAQLELEFGEQEAEQRRQFLQDGKHMEARLAAIEKELATEPEQLRERYAVVLTRLTPVGLLYLWPATR